MQAIVKVKVFNPMSMATTPLPDYRIDFYKGDELLTFVLIEANGTSAAYINAVLSGERPVNADGWTLDLLTYDEHGNVESKVGKGAGALVNGEWHEGFVL